MRSPHSPRSPHESRLTWSPGVDVLRAPARSRYRQSRRTPGRGGEIQAVAPHNKELRSYFDTLIEQCASPFTGAGDDDAISSSSDEELEQMALLFCKFDRDGDGLLNSDEFAAVVELVVGQTGQQFTHEHVVRCFHDCDVDASGAVDFNELLRYRRQGALRATTGVFNLIV